MNAIFLSERPEKIRQVFSPEVVDRISSLVSLEKQIISREELLRDPARFTDVEIVFSTWNMSVLTKEEIKTYLPSLRCVFYAAGSVQYFARPFLEAGVRVFSAWAANAVPVAEYTVAQIILAGKGFFAHNRLMHAKRDAEARAMRADYKGNYAERVGLIGCGMIGSLVAQMLKDYALDVCVYDPFLSEERARALSVTPCSLEELFATCRVVSNHLANNEATQGMLQYRHFSSMLPFSTFLNTGRGAQVVEDDLVRALRERPDLCAVLDVTYPEPAPHEHPFYTLPNCFLTPHIAGSLGNEVVRMAEYMEQECRRYLAGEPTRYEVTAKMLETMA